MADEFTPQGGHEPGERQSQASITLRPVPGVGGGLQAQSQAELMDPAHRALSDALQVFLRVVQFAMLILAVLFLFSGAQTVQENESGVRLVFGKVVDAELSPGFQLSYPFPMGELMKVDTANQTIEMRSEFMPFLSERERDRPLTEVAGNMSLEPDRDGSLITGDGNIVHVEYVVRYRTPAERATKFLENIHTDFERDIVRAVSKRAMVHAVAGVQIDELLIERGGTADGSLSGRVRGLAQQFLESIDAGIEIDGIEIERRLPPLALQVDFASVQSAEARAAQMRDEARSEATQKLVSAAGRAYQSVIDLMDRYETAVDAEQAALLDGNAEAAARYAQEGEQILAELAYVMESDEAGGRVARMLTEARTYENAEVSRRQTDLARYRARVEQFSRNPLVTINRDWSEAFVSFLDRDVVQVLAVPSTTRLLELGINADPEIAAAQERALKLQIAEQQRQERERLRQQERFRTDTDAVELNAG